MLHEKGDHRFQAVRFMSRDTDVVEVPTTRLIHGAVFGYVDYPSWITISLRVADVHKGFYRLVLNNARSSEADSVPFRIRPSVLPSVLVRVLLYGRPTYGVVSSTMSVDRVSRQFASNCIRNYRFIKAFTLESDWSLNAALHPAVTDRRAVWIQRYACILVSVIHAAPQPEILTSDPDPLDGVHSRLCFRCRSVYNVYTTVTPVRKPI